MSAYRLYAPQGEQIWRDLLGYLRTTMHSSSIPSSFTLSTSASSPFVLMHTVFSWMYKFVNINQKFPVDMLRRPGRDIAFYPNKIGQKLTENQRVKHANFACFVSQSRTKINLWTTCIGRPISQPIFVRFCLGKKQCLSQAVYFNISTGNFWPNYP